MSTDTQRTRDPTAGTRSAGLPRPRPAAHGEEVQPGLPRPATSRKPCPLLRRRAGLHEACAGSSSREGGAKALVWVRLCAGPGSAPETGGAAATRTESRAA